MYAFDYILILLAAVLLSNLVNRFVPVLSPPIVQIILGVLICLIPFGVFGFAFKLEPELFFVLFIAPLVFHSSMTADKQSLWRLKRPIAGAAVVLVLITVISLGYFVHAVIPVIPLAASFALVAALGPTDVVAVEAAARRITVPAEIMGVLSGESIVNDAMGIVCFQFAISAAMTGTFSAGQGLLRFLVLGAGGILAGLLLTGLKYMLIRWLRSLGVENSTLHILIDVLTPYIVYMCAESLSVSGILAVFAAGVAHSFMRGKFNPDTVKLQIAQDSVWSVLTFSFDGLVFVMLGTQLPGIFRAIGSGSNTIGNWKIIGCVLSVTLLIGFIRFLWWIFAVHKKIKIHFENQAGKVKSGVIFSLAGARGTVTLAIVMSIPLLLADGSAFPERDLLILLAGGVIVVSLLATNFILPLFAERKTGREKDEAERAAYDEIMQTVISRLNDASTPGTHAATRVVTRTYYSRANQKPAGRRKDTQTEEERTLRRDALIWEKENTLRLLEENKADEAAAKHILQILDVRIEMAGMDKKPGFIWVLKWISRRLFHPRIQEETTDGNAFRELNAANVQYVLDKLAAMGAGGPAVEKLSAEYQIAMNMWKDSPDGGDGLPRFNGHLIPKVAADGFRIERELIQQMYEEGRLSWETARKMRDNIVMLETKLQVE